jgi:hypothetical protein
MMRFNIISKIELEHSFQYLRKSFFDNPTLELFQFDFFKIPIFKFSLFLKLIFKYRCFNRDYFTSNSLLYFNQVVTIG